MRLWQNKWVFAVLTISLFLCVSCAPISHLSELLTLKGLSDEQQAQQREVQSQDKKFVLLKQELAAGKLSQYSTKKDFIHQFGSPIVSQEITLNGEAVEECLYRGNHDFFPSEKIYIYFNDQNRLVKWEYKGKEQMAYGK